MGSLEDALRFERSESPVYTPGTEFIYDDAKALAFQRILKQELQAQGRAKISDIAKQVGFEEVVLELQKLACGFEFLMPVKADTREPFFDIGDIAFFEDKRSAPYRSLLPKTDERILSDDEGIKGRNGFYQITGLKWMQGFDDWTPVVRSKDSVVPIDHFFKPEQFFDMRLLNGNFELSEAEWSLSVRHNPKTLFTTKGLREFAISDKGKFIVGYQVDIVSPDQITYFGLNVIRIDVPDPLKPFTRHRVDDYIDVDNNKKVSYRPGARLVITNNLGEREFDCKIDQTGMFTEVYQGDSARASTLYRFGGDYTKPIDFAKTIRNVFDAVNTNNPHLSLGEGFLMRRKSKLQKFNDRIRNQKILI